MNDIILKWADLIRESETACGEINEAQSKDFKFFSGEGELDNSFEKDLDQIGIENSNSKMYAISGSLIHFLAENIAEMLTSERPIQKADALERIREYFTKKDRWEEVQESEKHAKDRKDAEGASAYYASKTVGDNFTGD